MLRIKLRSGVFWLLGGLAIASCDSAPEPPQGLEVALVLDTSGSMSVDGRLDGLTAGASRFLEVLEARWTRSRPDARADELWLSLLPYSGRVNLRAHPEFFDKEPVNPQLACPNPRKGALGQDDSPLSLGRLPNPTIGRFSSRSYPIKRVCPAAAMVGPTRRLGEVKDAVSGLEARGGCTRFDLATIWGWRAVSPRWWLAWHGDPAAEAVPSRPSAKAVILLTDGANTPSCAMDRLTWKEADAQFLAACAEMRRQGIRVYTIYLGRTFEGPWDTLDRCAGPSGRAHHAADGEALIALFERLAGEVAALRPSS
ncbi:MAG: hypothetical protein QNJ30_25605 [Kiloniellales bacterium]|nr:hypothetical protein [Kiloniellales bacterium]